MSIFDNIVFDEFTLLEGEQAEAYKKRKEEEKAFKPHGRKDYSSSSLRRKQDKRPDEEKALEIHRKEAGHRHGNIQKKIKDYENSDEYKKGLEKLDKETEEFKNKKKKLSSLDYMDINKKYRDYRKTASKNVTKEDKDKYARIHINDREAIDATARHIRRHPKQYKESAFSDIEMI